MKKHIIEISQAAIKDLKKLPRFLLVKLDKWKRTIELVGLEETKKIPGYHDEPLYGDRKGQRSIRLNQAYRAFYIVSKETKEVRILEIIEVNKHEY
jgi:proteic killer suppression protein